jgi:SAM-dependent methyltransferase
MMHHRSLVVAFVLVACSRETPGPANVPEATAEPSPTAAASTASSTDMAKTADTPPVASEPAVASAPSPAASVASDGLPNRWERVPDIEYVPTPQNIVDKMLDVAKLKKTDVLYDLGCGDGRIVVTAAKKYGVKAIGFDIDPQRVRESRDNVAKNDVGHLVTIELKDVFKVDLSPATVVTLYLLPELNVKLIPQLEKLNPGARIVSHDFDMEGVDPLKKWTVMAPHHRPPHDDREHFVFLWKAPIKVKKKN